MSELAANKHEIHEVPILIEAQFEAVVESSLKPTNYSTCLIIPVRRDELFDLRAVVATVKACDLANPFLLDFCVASTCNFAGPPHIEVCRIDIRRKRSEVLLCMLRPVVSHVLICRQVSLMFGDITRDMEWFPSSKDSRRPNK